jgi:aerobic-type carbon monoxide dehydrogenase small subunit (CoxS/CutS family)
VAEVTRLNVNGAVRAIHADGNDNLLSILRDQLDLTGSKYGCGEGQCGACTVLIDGSSRRSCITPLSAVGQKQITTIEGLAAEDRLHPVQEAFLQEAAMQCAYCTSGMIMTAVSFLRTNSKPSAAEIAHFMEGNICRCGAHPRIIAAIQRAAAEMGNSKESRQ